jgi:hypothetical protein
MSKDKDRLTAARAVFDAVFGPSDISYYPRLTEKRSDNKRNLSDEIVVQISTELKLVNLSKSDSTALDAIVSLASTSLKEVKDLTEYQDQKASRLLTLISFFSALAGALFVRFATNYPFNAYLYGPSLNPKAVIVMATYISFAIFVLLALCGALVLFYATRTRFKWPSVAQGVSATTPPRVRSRLFYNGILAVTPSVWARQFTQRDLELDEPILAGSTEMKFEFAKDYILESYLVAAKVADKLRYMTPGQDLLFYSLKALLLWVVFLGLASIIIQ